MCQRGHAVILLHTTGDFHGMVASRAARAAGDADERGFQPGDFGDNALRIAQGLAQLGRETVSYTHLDVYKRQVYISLPTEYARR